MCIVQEEVVENLVFSTPNGNFLAVSTTANNNDNMSKIQNKVELWHFDGSKKFEFLKEDQTKQDVIKKVLFIFL